MDATDTLHQACIEALESYEQRLRRYTAKVEDDNQAKAEAIWHAGWTFRKTMSQAIDTLRKDLKEAGRVRDS